MKVRELVYRSEIAERLAEALKRGEAGFNGYVRNFPCDKWEPCLITGMNTSKFNNLIVFSYDKEYTYCGIEITDNDYEPFPDDQVPDLKCGDVIFQQSTKMELLILGIDKSANIAHVLTRSNWLTNKNLFEYFTKFDGSPIGRVKGSK